MKEHKDLHLDAAGRARMVDVSAKDITLRRARASARIGMRPATLEAIEKGLVKKGDVLAVAQVAAVMAVKKTPELIPMCHPLEIDAVDVSFASEKGEGGAHLAVTVEVSCMGRTGVEMEAMTGAAAAALTVYDMCKGIDRWMTVEDVRLMEKSGGRSGHLTRP